MKRQVIERLHWPLAALVPSTSVWDFNWDVLCVLDGCRVDAFREFYPDTESYWSVASTSKNWLRRTFDPAPVDLDRVGLITANPFSTEIDLDEFGFSRLEPVTEVDGIETVPPNRLRNLAIGAWDQLDLDYLVVHFMQPHVPFRNDNGWFDDYLGTETWGSEIWRLIGDEIPEDEFWSAYLDNLEWVLEDGVDPLQTRIDGRVGITADHGNGMGEFGIYAHPKQVVAPTVRRVPWHSFRARAISSAEEISIDSTQPEVDVEEQLAALGYR